ncbi:hypothetical protein MMC29_001461 [Sticta canariensis]|nr:hypothetical protein [Sticta canariensis]
MASPERPRKVAFDAQPTVRYIESTGRHPRKSPTMAKQVFERFNGTELTDHMLEEAAQLFNENYGTWGEDPMNPMAAPKPGSRVKLSKSRLRDQYLPNNAPCTYVRVTVEDRLAGNAFACRWSHKDTIVCWVTQLVVHTDFRERGLAAGLLNQLRQDDDGIYGLMSSHLAACLAAAKAFGSGIHTVAVGFICDNAGAIMKASPIGYVKEAELRGSVFNPEDASGLVSSVYTKFFVDHAEPLEALAWVREASEWPLGDLLDDHEFLVIIPNRRRNRSRSRSSSRPRVVGLVSWDVPRESS